ncbi:uncharacterized protein PADG_08080 [Paracoccidioides brasiliensis Pb18]|uniref:Uncharacterized protein n=1 Tax=Paracoccidioides brasiliensis (strain Pb18) TaxID=502780 RepID=C1GLE4_PARBD|nr:uncharacterized protein PADG_08080 [Paracoccidioides brasiliensis Pb18]EEH43260.2 hypothetical protein PADG_08080 [Paracoccidioides brasiliensis Pb18]
MNVLYKTEAANMRNLTRKEPETPGTVKIESSHGVKPRLCRRDPEDSWHWGACSYTAAGEELSDAELQAAVNECAGG